MVALQTHWIAPVLQCAIANDPRSDVEVAPNAVRTEAIRAVRTILRRSALPKECQSERPSHGRPCALVRLMHDVGLSLAAMSHSLAEGVDHTTDGPSARP